MDAIMYSILPSEEFFRADYDPRVHALGSGLEVKILDTFKMCFSTFSVMATTYADSWSDMSKPCGMDLWAMK